MPGFLEGCLIGSLSRVRKEAYRDWIGSGQWPGIMGFAQACEVYSKLIYTGTIDRASHNNS